MKAKISLLDSVGFIKETKEFEIPLMSPIKRTYKNGLPQEPMKKNRFILEIEGHKYLLLEDGIIIETENNNI